MRTISRLAAVPAAVLAVLGLLVVGPTSTASAATVAPIATTTAGAHTYTFSQAAVGTTTSTGTLAWNNTTWALTLTAKTGTLASGQCVTVYFDWRSKGHHDARALRDCTSNDTYSASFSDDNTKNLLGGPSRMGICYGTNDTTGTCTYYVSSAATVSTSSSLTTPPIQINWTPWPHPSWAYPCILSWTRKAADGTVSTFTDAHSRKRLLVGSTC